MATDAASSDAMREQMKHTLLSIANSERVSKETQERG